MADEPPVPEPLADPTQIDWAAELMEAYWELLAEGEIGPD